MEKYRNLGGDSNVVEYEVGDDYIRIRFRGGATYLYTYESAGRDRIEKAKRLALAGRGLNAFVNLRMKHAYAAKSPTGLA